MALPIAFGRERDVFVMGRANVDMYVTDPADSLESAVLFEKSVGGSAANIAVGLSRLGRQVGMISRVSADPFGDFVRQFLMEAGVDCQHVADDDSGARTSLAFAERRVEESQVLFYRNNAADLLIQPNDLPFHEWAKTSLLVVTGTGLSASPSRESTLTALESARGEGCRTVLDLDWREAAWQSPLEAPFFYTQAISQSDVVIGTVEEFSVLDQNTDWIGDGSEAPEGVQKLLQGGVSLVVVKRASLALRPIPMMEMCIGQESIRFLWPKIMVPVMPLPRPFFMACFRGTMPVLPWIWEPPLLLLWFHLWAVRPALQISRLLRNFVSKIRHSKEFPCLAISNLMTMKTMPW